MLDPFANLAIKVGANWLLLISLLGPISGFIAYVATVGGEVRESQTPKPMWGAITAFILTAIVLSIAGGGVWVLSSMSESLPPYLPISDRVEHAGGVWLFVWIYTIMFYLALVGTIIEISQDGLFKDFLCGWHMLSTRGQFDGVLQQDATGTSVINHDALVEALRVPPSSVAGQPQYVRLAQERQVAKVRKVLTEQRALFEHQSATLQAERQKDVALVRAEREILEARTQLIRDYERLLKAQAEVAVRRNTNG